MTPTRSPALVIAIAWIAALVPCGAVHADPADGVTVRAVHTERPGADGIGELALEITDTATGRGLDYDGRRLAAWLQRSPPATLSDAEISCSDKVRALASQGIGRRAAVDFNTYGLVTVNDDHTVTFINPFLGLRNAKLEGVVQLPGAAAAHLHVRGRHELWIAMRERDAVVVIDTDTHAITRTIAFAPGAGPQTLAADGPGVWVGFAGRDNWLHFGAFDRRGPADPTASQAPDARIDAPAAAAIVAGPQGRLLGLDARGVTLVDPATRAQWRASLPGASAAAWSALSSRWLVATAHGRLAWIDPADGTVAKVQDLGGPIAALVAFDDGRHVAAALPATAEVVVVDVATTAVLQRVAVVPEASALSSSTTFLYAHSPARGLMTLMSLADLRTGTARPVNVAIGTPAATPTEPAGTAAAPVLLAQSPDGAAMLVASVHDGQIYQYAEGMMAPVGSFSNYRRRPQALLLIDHGLEPLGQGRYRSTFRYTRGGAHELVVSGVRPRFAQCVRLALPEVPDAQRSATAAALPDAALVAAVAAMEGRALRVEVRLRTRPTQAPLGGVSDLVLLGFDRRSGWQQRVRLMEPTDPAEREPGRYVALLPVSAQARRIDLLVSSASQDMPYGAGLIGTVDGPAP